MALTPALIHVAQEKVGGARSDDREPLCGVQATKLWLPSVGTLQRFVTCPACREILGYEAL